MVDTLLPEHPSGPTPANTIGQVTWVISAAVILFHGVLGAPGGRTASSPEANAYATCHQLRESRASEEIR